MYIFGSGELFVKPFGANAATNPTPQKLGTMQEVSVDITASQKELYGKLQFPVAIARTAGKINFKAKFATINAKTLNDLFFGGTVAAACKKGMIDEGHTAGTTVTITPPSSGAFVEDFGVFDVVSGKQMTRLATPGTETAGTLYSVNESTGVYTFGTGQQATLISYSYTSTGGFSSTVPNKAMGSMPVFEANLVNNQFASGPSAASVNSYLKFFNCISAKITLPYKNEDFTIPEFDFSAFSDSSNNLFSLNLDD